MSTNTPEEASTQRWEGYSDYQSVSNRVAAAIDDAIDAFAYIQSLHLENERIRQREAAQARSRILGVTIKLLPELEANAGHSDTEDDDDVYRDILQRWTKSYDGGDGFLDRFQTIQLQKECPDWLHQLVKDIRKAGWEIGYLQAGRTVTESTLEPNEEQARSMFEE
ncbi:hypothetical protein [Haladaptatus cibarius]|uniref:hypothetical protein n=1 Tax=Haladaptatus cibarius TaxID=453847 RepID=UPI0006784C8E|nr:hypothetical protein [Haladaptatus cibarius]